MDNLLSMYLLGMFLLGSYLVSVESTIYMYDCRADMCLVAVVALNLSFSIIALLHLTGTPCNEKEAGTCTCCNESRQL